jgi:hypothetical protein
MCLPGCAPDWSVYYVSVRDVGNALRLNDLPGEISHDPPGIEVWIVDLESGDYARELLSLSDTGDGLHVDPAAFPIPLERGKYHAIVEFTLVPPPSWSLAPEAAEVLSFDVVTNPDRPWTVALWDDVELEFTWRSWVFPSM